jgi:glycogen phosphorylase
MDTRLSIDGTLVSGGPGRRLARSAPVAGEPNREGRWDGAADVESAVERLARRLPAELHPLARITYNLGWSWKPGGRELFARLDEERFARAGENPVRFLRDLPDDALAAAAGDSDYVERVYAVADALAAEVAGAPVGPNAPVAFLCAEFGVHASLPVYSGGLGVLAGDILKEASDQRLAFVGVGLLYRRGYFHQRVDLTGRQHEYWIESDPELLPLARVTDEDGNPLQVSVPVWDAELALRIWRADVGRVPLYLLDADVDENTPVERWVTSRLYEGTRAIRLAQYAALGLGAVRALAAMGIEPGLYHLNEGHPALAAVELARRAATKGTRLGDALAAVRERFVFTTHTPVPAGNETYERGELLSVLGRVPATLGFDQEELLRLGRIRPDDADEPAGLTPLAIRACRTTTGVSRRHGGVARAMWRPLFPDLPEEAVPIGHVTNGVHLPTWMAPEMRGLLDRHLGSGWERHAAEPSVWEPVDGIPDEELWAVRNALRLRLVESLRRRVVPERLARGEDIEDVLSAARLFDPDRLTVGFARRLAAYKRLNLLVHDPERTLALLSGDESLQLVFAGKAHPRDEAAKEIAQRVLSFRHPAADRRVAFVEDYDLRVALTLVAGCDVWINLPRPPLEASGTSGMKAALNGALTLSVLDGWWEEAYDGSNGWAIDGSADRDEAAQDARDADALYGLLEREVRPLFYQRDEAGVPRGWTARMRASLKSIGPRYNASRMLGDYVRDVYG